MGHAASGASAISAYEQVSSCDVKEILHRQSHLRLCVACLLLHALMELLHIEASRFFFLPDIGP